MTMSVDRFANSQFQNAVVEPQGFVMCPAPPGGSASSPWQQLYDLAYIQAQAVVRPSILDRMQRDLFN
jgi:hypothetical protein